MMGEVTKKQVDAMMEYFNETPLEGFQRRCKEADIQEFKALSHSKYLAGLVNPFGCGKICLPGVTGNGYRKGK